MMTERLLESLERDEFDRLRWLVCRGLGLRPGSVTERLMSRRSVLRCACHMVLDGQSDISESSGFDMERFRKLGGGR